MIEDFNKIENSNNDQINFNKIKLKENERLNKYLISCKSTIFSVIICFFIFLFFLIGMFAVGTSHLWLNIKSNQDSSNTVFSNKHILVVVSSVLFYISLFALAIGLIIHIIWCIETLILDNDYLKNDARAWGILGLFCFWLLLPEFIMKSKTNQHINKIKQLNN